MLSAEHSANKSFQTLITNINLYIMEYSMTTQFMMELIGTLVLVLFGDGVCACVTLNKSKGQNSGWIVITIGWGLAVCMGVLVAGPYTGAHINPAVSLGLAAAGMFPWASVPYYIAAQMIGGVLGGILVWLFYKDHYAATDNDAAKLGTFATAPAIRNYPVNLFCEVIATLALVFIIICFSTDGNAGNLGDVFGSLSSIGNDPVNVKIGLASLGPIPVTLLIIALGMSLGGPTGYAMNPARDLSPRIAHALVMKGDNDWGYSWVPVVGPMIGGAIAGVLGAWLLTI